MLDLNLRVHSDLHLPSDIVTHKHFIDGQYLESASGDVTERVAPSHGVVVSRAAKGTEAEVNLAVAAARRAFDNGRWCRIAAKERAIVLTKVADLIEQNVERFALIESLESGKPISQARGEVGGAAELWRFAASLARTSTGETHNNLGDDILAMTVKEPIGVVSIITPWNFLPASVVMKDGLPHAEITTSESQSALLPFNQENMSDWAGKDILLGIRPEAITDPDGVDRKSKTVVPISNRVGVTEPAGADTFVTMELAGKDCISRMRADADVTTGEIFDFVINMDKAVAFDPQSEMRIK